EERAHRRYLELVAKGYEVDIKALEHEIAERDRMDMEREIAPLVQAEDAIYLDTTSLSIEEVIQTILSYTQRV
ncbi:MAG: (d)CMP kinase, partial [Selenomonadales bacterium]|nr:(d)CMP kinase [Selenomonadales bacterium]